MRCCQLYETSPFCSHKHWNNCFVCSEANLCRYIFKIVLTWYWHSWNAIHERDCQNHVSLLVERNSWLGVLNVVSFFPHKLSVSKSGSHLKFHFVSFRVFFLRINHFCYKLVHLLLRLFLVLYQTDKRKNLVVYIYKITKNKKLVAIHSSNTSKNINFKKKKNLFIIERVNLNQHFHLIFVHNKF